MPTITFLPAGISCDYSDSETLFDIGARCHIPIETACVGKGNCGLCRVKIIQGEEFLSPYTDEESKHLGNVYYLTKIRLSCRTQAQGGDVVVALVPKRRSRKSHQKRVR